MRIDELPTDPAALTALVVSMGAELDRLREQGATSVDALLIPEINTFRNQARVQLRIEYLRASVD